MKDLTNKCKQVLKANLVSIIKFGTEGEPNNITIVTKKLDCKVLSDMKDIVRDYAARNQVVPLIFTKKELLESADVFPLEFLDMKFPHEVLYGEDVMNAVKFEKRAVRKQVEFELRSKLIHLRANFLWIKDDKELRSLLKSAIPTLMPLFYGLLFLKNKSIPANLDALYKAVEKSYKVNFSLFRTIRRTDLKDTSLSDVVAALMQLLEKLINIVDKLKV